MAIQYIPRPMPDCIPTLVGTEWRYRACVLVDMRQVYRARITVYRARITFADRWRAMSFAGQACVRGVRGKNWRRV